MYVRLGFFGKDVWCFQRISVLVVLFTITAAAVPYPVMPFPVVSFSGFPWLKPVNLCNLEVKRSKVNVTRPINAVTDNVQYAGRDNTIFLKLACFMSKAVTVNERTVSRRVALWLMNV